MNVRKLSVKYIHITSKPIQFLGTNLRKSVQEIYNENYESQMREIKDLNKWKYRLCSWMRRVSLTPHRNPNSLFCRDWQDGSKFCLRTERSEYISNLLLPNTYLKMQGLKHKHWLPPSCRGLGVWCGLTGASGSKPPVGCNSSGGSAGEDLLPSSLMWVFSPWQIVALRASTLWLLAKGLPGPLPQGPLLQNEQGNEGEPSRWKCGPFATKPLLQPKLGSEFPSLLQ